MSKYKKELLIERVEWIEYLYNGDGKTYKFPKSTLHMSRYEVLLKIPNIINIKNVDVELL
jgi:hypothetical protein